MLSCDLLEKSYFCSIANNHIIAKSTIRLVVICLKNRTFAVSQTTKRKQKANSECCDLLEKSYFCSIANNRIPQRYFNALVVICLKNRTFAVSQTTSVWFIKRIATLWFAWKIVLLQYRKQRIVIDNSLSSGCDLLEKSYFCSIANNYHAHEQYSNKLWFAWKIVLLQYRKQQSRNSISRSFSCDLLEKSYFCSIANNTEWKQGDKFQVVICLKNRTFAVSQTTYQG